MPKVTHLNSSLGKESSEKKTRKEFETKVNSVSNSDDDLVLHCGLGENKSSDPYSLFKKIISRLRCSSTFIKNNKRIRLIGSLSTLSLLILTFLLVFPVVIKSDIAEGTSGVVEVPTLTMVVGQESANLDLVVRSSNGTFATTNSTSSIAFTVKTNNYTGYTLSVSADDNNQVLTNSNTGDTLSSITSAVDTNTFASSDTTLNKWGYLPSKLNSMANTNYQPAPTKTDTLLDKTNTANTTANNYTIMLGAKVDYTVSSGLYTNTYTLTAIANPVAYSINYYNGIDNDDRIGLQYSETNTLATITLNPTYDSGSAPTRATYFFVGWCDTIPTADSNNYWPATVCSGNTYQTGGNYNLDPTVSNKDLKLYAYWKPTSFEDAYKAANKTKVTTQGGNSYYAMQDMNSAICAAVTPAQTTTLLDNRTPTTSSTTRYAYSVAKISDKCWMTQNLIFGYGLSGSSVTINSSTTNINKTVTLPLYNIVNDSSSSSGKCYATHTTDLVAVGSGYSNACIYSGSNTSSGGATVWYNYAAASAGTIVGLTNSSNASYDICSSAWRLPTTTEQASVYGHSPLYNPVSGGFYAATQLMSIENGYWWSATLPSSAGEALSPVSSSMRYLAWSNGFYRQGNHRGLGFYIRCVAK